VVGVDDMTSGKHLERELLLIKLEVTQERRVAFDALIARDGARVIADQGTSIIIELTSSEAAVTRLVQELAGVASIREVVRSGALGIGQGGAAKP
ncbi:MAG: hypothetical protein ACRET4_01380, partial [Steroidobacteraceae bacterium]